jgi:hypothetical protein
MHSLLEGISCPKIDNVQKEIGGYLGDPDGGAGKEIPENHIYEYREGYKKKEQTRHGGAKSVELLELIVKGEHKVLSHGVCLHGA